MGEPVFGSERVLIFTEYKYWFHQRGKQGENLAVSQRWSLSWQELGLGSDFSPPFSLPILFVTLQLHKTLSLPLALEKHLSFRVVWFKGRTKGNKAQYGICVC